MGCHSGWGMGGAGWHCVTPWPRSLCGRSALVQSVRRAAPTVLTEPRSGLTVPAAAHSCPAVLHSHSLFATAETLGSPLLVLKGAHLAPARLARMHHTHARARSLTSGPGWTIYLTYVSIQVFYCTMRSCVQRGILHFTVTLKDCLWITSRV